MTEDLFDKSPCGYFCFSDDGNLIMVNQTLASILKFDKKNLTGKNVESIFTLPTRIFFQTHFFSHDQNAWSCRRNFYQFIIQ